MSYRYSIILVYADGKTVILRGTHMWCCERMYAKYDKPAYRVIARLKDK